MCVFQRSSFPNAIAHLDCNSFFASVEVAYNPALQGQPVMVVGMGGGCVITANYPARKYGIKTGMTCFEARKLCPQGVFIESDFKKYQLYQQRILSIISQYTPQIEYSSIDEAFFDLQGLRRLYREPYPAICDRLRIDIQQKLGITVSIGLSTSKTLAKIASDFQKPNALTVVSGKNIALFLEKIKLADVPGIGSNSLALLTKFQIHTPLQFALASPALIQKLMGKNGLVLQQELKGNKVSPIVTTRQAPKSLARTRSFPLTQDQEAIYSELMKNLELAFWQLRCQQVQTKQITVMLRDEHYQIHAQELILPESINCQTKIHFRLKAIFHSLYNPKLKYRSTGIITSALIPEQQIQPSLFDNELNDSKTISLFSQIDKLNDKYGRQTLSFASAKKAPHLRFQLANLKSAYLGETTVL